MSEVVRLDEVRARKNAPPKSDSPLEASIASTPEPAARLPLSLKFLVWRDSLTSSGWGKLFPWLELGSFSVELVFTEVPGIQSRMPYTGRTQEEVYELARLMLQIFGDGGFRIENYTEVSNFDLGLTDIPPECEPCRI